MVANCLGHEASVVEVVFQYFAPQLSKPYDMGYHGNWEAIGILAPKHWKKALRGACAGKEDGLAIHLLERIRNAPECLEEIYRAGRDDLGRIIIELGVNNLKYALRGACRAGDEQAVWYLIMRGAYAINDGLEAAARGGHEEIVKTMIAFRANAIDRAMTAACRGGHVQLVEYLVRLINREPISFDAGLSAACFKGHVKCMRLMIIYGAKQCMCLQPLDHHMCDPVTFEVIRRLMQRPDKN
jgi:hypothetical protein